MLPNRWSAIPPVDPKACFRVFYLPSRTGIPSGCRPFRRLVRAFCLILLVPALLGCVRQQPIVQQAAKGRLDLSRWDFAARGPVLLDGEWTLYGNRLLTPADIRKMPPGTDHMDVRRLWRDRETGDPAPPGTATLGLTLTLGADTGLMGLELAGMTPAYRLWLDGRLLARHGQTGEDRVSERPGFSRQVVVFQPPERPFTLLLQVSSHNMMGGILPRPRMVLGTRGQMQGKAFGERQQADILLGIFLLMAVYHLLLFWFYRGDASTLYFALYCFLWLANTGVGYAGTWLMPVIEPWGSARLVYALDLFTYYLSLPAILQFFKSMFPEEVPARLPRLALAGAVLFMSGILAAQALGRYPLETRLPQYFHLVTLACVVRIAVCLARARMKRRPGAGLILGGFALLALVGLNDILHDLHLIRTGFFMPFGMLVFIVFQSFALARRFSRAFTAAEALSRELTEKNTALSRMDRLKDEFLANTSHELRTPLSGIIGISESLLAGSAGDLPRAARHNLEMVAGSGRRLSTLINDILDATRLKNQDLSLDLKAVDTRAAADTVLALLGPLAGEKQLELANEIPKGLAPVRADEDRFQQILFNLVGNAVKYSSQGRITVLGRADGRQVAVSVRDRGMGIPEPLHQAIFEPFRQADAGTGRSGRGMGLGLAITADLVRLHGGTIRLDSAPGRGSTFTVTLPRSDGQPEETPGDARSPGAAPPASPRVMMPPVPPGPTASCARQGEGPVPRILAVDDDPVNRQVLVNHLCLEGFAVDTAPDGVRALEQVATAPPDLLLLDIMMPGMTGYEVCRRLRQEHAASRLPVIMLTAKTRVRDIVEGFNSGASDYLAKPFETDELLARVGTQLRLKQAYQTLEENIRLKKELARRRQTELDLRLNQRRMAHLLDTVTDMVITVNESREIAFCNRPAAQMLGFDDDALLGKPLDLLFDPDWVRAMDQGDQGRPGAEPPVSGFPRSCENIDIQTAGGRTIRVDVTITLLTVDDEGVQALILRSCAPEPAPPSLQKTLTLIEEINRHQERLKGLEESLNGYYPQLKRLAPGIEQEIRGLDRALDGIQNNLISSPPADRRHLGVTVMQLSLDYWYDATDRDKASLASESGIWKAYTDRHGYTRTQTLDKYLSEETLPRQPRWKWISRTAVYVLAACATPSPLRDQLEAALAQFREE